MFTLPTFMSLTDPQPPHSSPTLSKHHQISSCQNKFYLVDLMRVIIICNVDLFIIFEKSNLIMIKCYGTAFSYDIYVL
jgi:hypothetical protein